MLLPLDQYTSKSIDSLNLSSTRRCELARRAADTQITTSIVHMQHVDIVLSRLIDEVTRLQETYPRETLSFRDLSDMFCILQSLKHQDSPCYHFSHVLRSILLASGNIRVEPFVLKSCERPTSESNSDNEAKERLRSLLPALMDFEPSNASSARAPVSIMCFSVLIDPTATRERNVLPSLAKITSGCTDAAHIFTDNFALPADGIKPPNHLSSISPNTPMAEKKLPAALQMHPPLRGLSAISNYHESSSEALARLDNNGFAAPRSKLKKESILKVTPISFDKDPAYNQKLPLTPVSPMEFTSPVSATADFPTPTAAIANPVPLTPMSSHPPVSPTERVEFQHRPTPPASQPPTLLLTPPFSGANPTPYYVTSVPMNGILPPGVVPQMLVYNPAQVAVTQAHHAAQMQFAQAHNHAHAQAHASTVQMAPIVANHQVPVSSQFYQPMTTFIPQAQQPAPTADIMLQRSVPLQQRPLTPDDRKDITVETIANRSILKTPPSHPPPYTKWAPASRILPPGYEAYSQGVDGAVRCDAFRVVTKPAANLVPIQPARHSACAKVISPKRSRTSFATRRAARMNAQKLDVTLLKERGHARSSRLREMLLRIPPLNWEISRSESEQADLNNARIQGLMDLYVSLSGNKMLGLHAVFELAKWYWSAQFHESKVASRWVLRGQSSGQSRCTAACGGANMDKRTDHFVEHCFSCHFPDIQPIQCMFCEKRFATRRMVKEHFLKNHSIWEISSWLRFMCRAAEVHGGVSSGCNSSDIMALSRALRISHEVDISFDSTEFKNRVMQRVTYESEFTQLIQSYKQAGNEKLGLYRVQRFMKRYWEHRNICYESAKAWSDKVYAEWDEEDDGIYCFDCERHFICPQNRIRHRAHVHKKPVDCGVCLFCNAAPQTRGLLWDHMYLHHKQEDVAKVIGDALGDSMDGAKVAEVIYDTAQRYYMEPKAFFVEHRQ